MIVSYIKNVLYFCFQICVESRQAAQEDGDKLQAEPPYEVAVERNEYGQFIFLIILHHFSGRIQVSLQFL